MNSQAERQTGDRHRHKGRQTAKQREGKKTSQKNSERQWRQFVRWTVVWIRQSKTD